MGNNKSMRDIYSKYVVWDDNNVKGFFEQYRYLSNFHPCRVWFEGMEYPSSEHAYMAGKTLDKGIRKLFSCDPGYNMTLVGYDGMDYEKLEVLSAKDAKAFGRTVELRPNWEEIKYSIMLAVVFDKFWRHQDIRDALISTGDKYLEETNHWKDECWGVNCWTGKGTNWLGEILMKVRTILK